MSWVSLNEEGKRLWGDVFPDGRVPVCSIDFQKAELEGAGTEKVIMVNWTALTGQQQEAVLVKIGKRTGARREWIVRIAMIVTVTQKVSAKEVLSFLRRFWVRVE